MLIVVQRVGETGAKGKKRSGCEGGKGSDLLAAISYRRWRGRAMNAKR